MRTTLLVFVTLTVLFTTAGCQTVNRRQIGNLVLEDIPEIPQRISDQMRQYQNTRAASLCGWHPTGDGIFIRTRFGQTTQLHFVQSPLGTRSQQTFFDEPVSGVTVNPDPDASRLLFTKDVGGDEYHQIYSFDLINGRSAMATDGKGISTAPVWSDDGAMFAFYSTRRNDTDWDIYISRAEDPQQAECIVQEGGVWYPMDFSPDGTKLLVKKRISVNESYVYIYDMQAKTLTEMNPVDEIVSYGQARWAANSRDIYFTSNEYSHFHHLWVYQDDSKINMNLTQSIQWDVSEIDMSPDGQRLAFVTNENGFSKLYYLNTDDNQIRPAKDIPAGVMSSLYFHPSEPVLGFTLNRPVQPADVYAYDFSDDSLTRWTASETGGLTIDNFVEPELIEYETFDYVKGKPRKIPAIYYKPKTEGPWPVLIFFHGGPESQSRPRFSYRMQYWVNELGLAVIAPNVRGSTGYGKEFVNLDNGYLREDSVKDGGALLDWITKQPELDASRVGVYGGSYGGYMVLASMIHYPDRIKCGIDMVGISNFVTFLENTKDYRRDRRRVEYGDERDSDMRQFLIEISPTTNAHKITGELFIAQGLNDPRVPASEAEQMLRQVRKNGQSVWYMLGKDEGHGFKKKRNADVFYDAISLFLEMHLLD
ncbi:MAG: S9 family peptidase [Planctomycetota bacterium]|jgi:dipeptidyl aminopeptidase/acylaminoacyl peptidase